MKKVKKEKEPTGDDIQIKYETSARIGYVVPHTFRLHVKSLGFQNIDDDLWEGTWENEKVSVRRSKPGYDIVFSDNFPSQHKGEALDEVNRITRQFN